MLTAYLHCVQRIQSQTPAPGGGISFYYGCWWNTKKNLKKWFISDLIVSVKVPASYQAFKVNNSTYYKSLSIAAIDFSVEELSEHRIQHGLEQSTHRQQMTEIITSDDFESHWEH